MLAAWLITELLFANQWLFPPPPPLTSARTLFTIHLVMGWGIRYTTQSSPYRTTVVVLSIWRPGKGQANVAYANGTPVTCAGQLPTYLLAAEAGKRRGRHVMAVRREGRVGQQVFTSISSRILMLSPSTYVMSPSSLSSRFSHMTFCIRPTARSNQLRCYRHLFNAMRYIRVLDRRVWRKRVHFQLMHFTCVVCTFGCFGRVVRFCISNICDKLAVSTLAQNPAVLRYELLTF